MADIDRIPSELEVGVFADNLLSTQLDTQERLASLYSGDFNVPDIQHSTIPKQWNTDDILKSKELPSATDYLNSNDPKVREIGKNLLEQDSGKNTALTKGVGLPSMVRYQEGQEKFSQGTKFGFNPYTSMAENEDFYWHNVWDNYSTFGKTWRTMATFSARAATKFVTGLVGMVGDLGAMAWNGLQEIGEGIGGPKNNFWADVSDNWLARSMEEANDYVKMHILPTYKNINYDNKGAFSKLTDPYFWMNDLADGVGFLAQFAVPATLFGKAATLGKAGKLGRFGQVMSTGIGELPTASRLTKGIGNTVEFLTGSRNVGGITAHAFNTTMESVAETKEGFDTTVKDLIAKGYTEHEAKQIAAENAPSQFGMNMAILSFSNGLENRWFQRWAGNTFNPTRTSRITAAGLAATKPGTVVGNFFAKNPWGNRIYFYGKEGAKAVGMEGFWEENAQLAAQRSARGEYMRMGDDTLSSGKLEKSVGFWNQLIKQTYDQSWFGKGDREAADSIMAGAVIGILGSTFFNKTAGTRDEIISVDGVTAPRKAFKPEDLVGKTVTVVKPKTFFPEGRRRQELRDNATLVAQIKNAQDAWLNINVMPDDLYDTNGKIDPVKAKARVEEINTKLAKISSMAKRVLELEDLTDQTRREQLQYLLFGDYVKAHVINGSGKALINRLKTWGTKTKEELAMYGVTEEIAKDPVQWANVAQDMLNEYENIDRIHYANNTDETVNSYFAKEKSIKSIIFDYIAQKKAAQVTAAKYGQLEADANPFKSVDTFNSYNHLIAQRESLKFTISSQKVSPQDKEFYKAELAKVEEQIEMRKKSLPEHQTGNQSDMVFEMGSDVKAQEDEIMETVGEYIQWNYARKEFELAAESFDRLVKEYSDPETGMKKYNEMVDYWQSRPKARIAKLQNMGYDEAEITNMTPEQQEEIIKNNTKKEEPKAPAEKKNEPAAQQPETLEQLRAKALTAIQIIDKTRTEETLDKAIENLMAHIQKNPEFLSTLGPTGEQIYKAITEYLQAKVAAAKANQTPENSQHTSTQTTNNAVIVPPATPNQEVKVEPIIPAEDQPIVITSEGIIKERGAALIQTLETERTNPDEAAFDKAAEEFDALINSIDPDIAWRFDENFKVELYSTEDSQRRALDAGGMVRSDITSLNGHVFKVGDKLSFAWEGSVVPSVVTKVDTNGKILDLELIPDSHGNSYYIIKDGIYQIGIQRLSDENRTPQDKNYKKTEIVITEVNTENVVPQQPPIPPDTVPKSYIDEIREAYRLNQQALENATTFKEEAEKEGMTIHNNKLDDHSDSGKNLGTININTSNPDDLVKGTIKEEKNNIMRFNFLDNLLSEKLDKTQFKIVLQLSKKGEIFGIVGRADGEIITFGENGMPKAGGDRIFFYLDYDMFTPQNINKRRQDVVKPPFQVAPWVSFIDPVTGKRQTMGETFIRPPLNLHPSFQDKDVIAVLKDRILTKKVTASIEFVLQGLLYRDGITNSYSKLPKNSPTTTATELLGKNHIRDIRGIIPSDTVVVRGTYRRQYRVHFALYKDLNDHSKGVEVVEFHPFKLKDLKDEEGKSISGVLTPFIQKAIDGNLETSPENLLTLKTLLRPDQFMVLDLGSNILVVNLKKFKKLLTDDIITTEKLRALTTLDDVMESDMNIYKMLYEHEGTVELLSGILSTGEDNYMRFVNQNVATSAKPVKIKDSEGYARINKRIALSLDEDMNEMTKLDNQKQQQNKSPEVTEVKIEEDLTDKEKTDAVNTVDDEAPLDLPDDFTEKCGQ